MIVKRIILSIFICQLAIAITLAQPANYYNTASGKSGEELQQALHDIIDNHTIQSYASLWTAFKTTDDKADGTVWDMYSDNPDGEEPYVYTFVSDQCGNYSGEGSCYNREHSFPKSWFGDIAPMNTDLFHLYPTDGYVNGKRSNYPFGETNSPSWTSLNGSKLGSCSVAGYTGTIFEPIDEYKGDFARTYFYMATRYYGEDNSWIGSGMTDGAQPKPWARVMLMQWHNDDLVSAKEEERNDAVYVLQGNRNPFIDNPEYVALLYEGGSVDELPPEIDSITANATDMLVLWFNEPLDPASALLAGNYQISSEVVVESATFLSAEQKAIKLAVADIENGNYTLVINGVSDLSGNIMAFAIYGFSVDIEFVQPECFNDLLTMYGGSSFSYLVLYNDILPGAINVSINQQPAHGTATLETDNSITYYPESTFNQAYDTIGYKVCMEANPGACDSALMVVFVDRPIGIEIERAENEASIYPNPNNGEFYVRLSGEQIKISSMKLHDLFGRDIPFVNDGEGNFHSISISAKPGVYYLNLMFKDGANSCLPVMVQ